MVDEQNLEASLRRSLKCEFARGAVDLTAVRDLVSSPRLLSFGVKAFTHSGLVRAGDSFLDAHTMLADGAQKTYAMSLAEWKLIEGRTEYVNHCDLRDGSVMKLQIWSVDPLALDAFAMGIAIALSYKRSELLAESRISSALNELMSKWGYYCDDF
ncbi:hypothetical protein OO256_06385 [Pseudomonas sp. DCB_CB]|uniref:hypothetical protein n=1 Tax=Pseudomonas TaxID=286 RepID=UPI0022496A40|nr:MULTISPECIES: hypothetical protein [unclassified Pseudomonas]MCX2690105.1 hypothetical protein [Pseudomonas sp. DCB_BZ]MCX2855729.1 hypothetical protein [Pseudomonas sp. DCB_CB]